VVSLQRIFSKALLGGKPESMKEEASGLLVILINLCQEASFQSRCFVIAHFSECSQIHVSPFHEIRYGEQVRHLHGVNFTSHLSCLTTSEDPLRFGHSIEVSPLPM
jgi:hypothetical protein